MYIPEVEVSGSLRSRAVVLAQQAPRVPWQHIDLGKRDDAAIDDDTESVSGDELDDDSDDEDDVQTPTPAAGAATQPSPTTQTQTQPHQFTSSPVQTTDTSSVKLPTSLPSSVAPLPQQQTTSDRQSSSSIKQSLSLVTPALSLRSSSASQFISFTSTAVPVNFGTTSTAAPSKQSTTALISKISVTSTEPTTLTSASSSSPSSSPSLSPASQQGIQNGKNEIDSPLSSVGGKTGVAVIVVVAVAAVALFLAGAIFFIRRHFRKRREGDDNLHSDSTLPSGPYDPPTDQTSQLPRPPRIFLNTSRNRPALRSWHESTIWGSSNSSHIDTAETIATSEAFAAGRGWRDRVKSSLSNNAIARNQRMNLVNPNLLRDAEKSGPLARNQTFRSPPGAAPQHQGQSPMRKNGRTYVGKELISETQSEQEAGEGRVEIGSEVALQRELARQGFGGKTRSIGEAHRALEDPLSRKARASVVGSEASEPARWKTARSWVGEQRERINQGRIAK